MRRRLLIAAALALLTTCARQPTAPPAVPAEQPLPRVEPLSPSGNRSPYRVHGRTYRVLPSAAGYRATGVASWYGPKFHGRPTSSGEVFDMYQFTAAHRTLPLPTYAQVTNLANGRSVVVRVNDRGPFKDNRIIDLSFAAARELDLIDSGTGRVDVIALDPRPGQPLPEVIEASGIFVQAGAFGERDNALALLERLRQAGISRLNVYSVPAGGRLVHRVRIGPLASAEAADAMVARLGLLGLEAPRIVFE